MEKKKLLLVAVSVGVVLLIIIGIPLMMIAPRQNAALSPMNAERDWNAAFEPDNIQQIQAPAFAEPPAFTNNVPPEAAAFAPPEEISPITTITVPIPEAAAVPDTPVAQTRKSTVTIAPTPAPPAPKPAAPKPAAPKPATPKPEPAAKPPAAKAANTASPQYNTYWVQTGAFSTKIRAEGAKESLANKGITSVIDNRDIDGKTWYRVRVGPYVSETEAQYWLALVKSIDGFGESQIRLTQAVQ